MQQARCSSHAAWWQCCPTPDVSFFQRSNAAQRQEEAAKLAGRAAVQSIALHLMFQTCFKPEASSLSRAGRLPISTLFQSLTR